MSSVFIIFSCVSIDGIGISIFFIASFETLNLVTPLAVFIICFLILKSLKRYLLKLGNILISSFNLNAKEKLFKYIPDISSVITEDKPHSSIISEEPVKSISPTLNSFCFSFPILTLSKLFKSTSIFENIFL